MPTWSSSYIVLVKVEEFILYFIKCHEGPMSCGSCIFCLSLTLWVVYCLFVFLSSEESLVKASKITVFQDWKEKETPELRKWPDWGLPQGKWLLKVKAKRLTAHSELWWCWIQRESTDFYGLVWGCSIIWAVSQHLIIAEIQVYLFTKGQVLLQTQCETKESLTWVYLFVYFSATTKPLQIHPGSFC